MQQLILTIEINNRTENHRRAYLSAILQFTPESMRQNLYTLPKRQKLPCTAASNKQKALLTDASNARIFTHIHR